MSWLRRFCIDDNLDLICIFEVMDVCVRARLCVILIVCDFDCVLSDYYM